MSEVKEVNTQVVTVVNVNPKSPLRITALGSQPLVNGSKFRCSTDFARTLAQSYGKFLEVGVDVQTGVKLANGLWEAVADGKGGGGKSKKDADEKLADSDVVTPEPTETAVEKPANKDMAGKSGAKK